MKAVNKSFDNSNIRHCHFWKKENVILPPLLKDYKIYRVNKND